jgi:signal transduction histidine kinase
VINIVVSQPDSESVMLEYFDNGSGMDEEQLTKVFHPFFTTRRGSGGSGLGGNIIYNLVTQVLKGSIQVKSESGKGVHFTLLFPVVMPQQKSE